MKKNSKKLAYLTLAMVMVASCSMPKVNNVNPSNIQYGKIASNSISPSKIQYGKIQPNTSNLSKIQYGKIGPRTPFKIKAAAQTCNGFSFNELAYLIAFQDVDTAVRNRTYNLHSGLDHYVNSGESEGRGNDPTYKMLRTKINNALTVDGFNELAYVMAFADVDTAVRNRTYNLHSGLEHYINAGKAEGRGNDPTYQQLKTNINNAVNANGFNDLAYLMTFSDVDIAVKNRTYHSGVEHFVRYGQAEGRGNNANYQQLTTKINDAVNIDGFNELAYLLGFPDVDNAVIYNLYNLHSGLEHYINSGKLEGRGNNANYQNLTKIFNGKFNGKVSLSPTLVNFAGLAGSTVTNTGPTVVTGDLGVSPGTAIVGFDVSGGPGTLNGNKQAGNPTAAQAQLDLTTAYNDAASRTCAPVNVTSVGNLGGMTLAPGLYNSTSSLEISSGDLTLDAQGDANATWIFQMATTFTMTPGRQVILSGGARANNIFWQVGSSVTLGTTSVFKGNILGAVSITMNSGASMEGRALAQAGALSLSSSTLTIPTP